MSQSQQSGVTPSKQEMVRIRMKPGCGRMMIGRSWRLPDGTISKSRPKRAEDSLETEEEWLEAREVDQDGNPKDGPVAEVPMEFIKKFLVDGKPARVIEGYKMHKSGGGQGQDENGKPILTAPTYAPTSVAGSFDDATFEIVR